MSVQPSVSLSRWRLTKFFLLRSIEERQSLLIDTLRKSLTANPSSKIGSWILDDQLAR